MHIVQIAYDKIHLIFSSLCFDQNVIIHCIGGGKTTGFPCWNSLTLQPAVRALQSFSQLATQTVCALLTWPTSSTVARASYGGHVKRRWRQYRRLESALTSPSSFLTLAAPPTGCTRGRRHHERFRSSWLCGWRLRRSCSGHGRCISRRETVPEFSPQRRRH
jgi:hypothetical protein